MNNRDIKSHEHGVGPECLLGTNWLAGPKSMGITKQKALN